MARLYYSVDPILDDQEHQKLQNKWQGQACLNRPFRRLSIKGADRPKKSEEQLSSAKPRWYWFLAGGSNHEWTPPCFLTPHSLANSCSVNLFYQWSQMKGLFKRQKKARVQIKKKNTKSQKPPLQFFFLKKKMPKGYFLTCHRMTEKKKPRSQSLAQVWLKPEVAGMSPARMETMKPETVPR